MRTPLPLITVLMLAAQVTKAADAPAPPANAPAPDKSSAAVQMQVTGKAMTDVAKEQSASTQTKLVSHEELTKYGDINLSDALRRVPGVQVEKGIPKLQGLGGGYVQMLVNGQPTARSFTLDSLSAELVDHIEIANMSLASQSNSAVAGTINIILKQAKKSTRDEAKLSELLVKDFKQTSASYTHNMVWDDVAAQAILTLNGDAGNIDNTSSTTSAGFGQGLPSLQAMKTTGSFKRRVGQIAPSVTIPLGNHETLSVQGFSQETRRNMDEDIARTDDGQTLDANRDTRFARLQDRIGFTWEKKESDYALSLQYQADRNARNTLEDLLEADSAPLDIIDHAHVVDLFQNTKVKYSTVSEGPFSWTAGAEVGLNGRYEDHFHQEIQNSSSDATLADFRSSVNRRAAFLESTWQQSAQLTLYSGLRYELINTSARDSDGFYASNLQKVLTPTLQATYKPEQIPKLQFRVGVNKSILPLKPEQFITYQKVDYLENDPTTPATTGNPNLHPQEAAGFNFSVEKYFLRNSMVSATYSHRSLSNYVRDVVSYSAPTWISQPQNIGSADADSIELTTKLSLEELTDSKIPLDIKITGQRAWSSVDRVHAPDNRLDDQRPSSFSTRLDYRFKELPVSVGMSYSIASGYAVQEDEFFKQYINVNRTLSFNASWKVSRDLTARFIVNDLLKPDDTTTTIFTNKQQSATKTEVSKSYGSATLAIEASF